MSNKGPEGNKRQLLIALELSKGKTPAQISEETGWPTTAIYDIKKRIKQGWKPDLSEEAIAAAPESSGWKVKGVKYKKKKSTSTFVPPPSGNGKSAKGDSGEEDDDGSSEDAQSKKKQPVPATVSMAAIQIRCQYTPIMYMARIASEEQWGWSADMPFEDFIDIILIHFFKDRGITLQGYIVDDEVDDGNGNKPDKNALLENKVNELVALLKG